MNINFSDGINDGKFFSIYSGKYDEFGEEDIDISTEIEEDEEDDTDTCLNRFAALEKDASKIHMDLNNLRNEYNGIFHNQEVLNDKVYTINNKIDNLTSEFRGSCKDWNDLSDTVDHMLNSIAELRTIMDRADDRLNKRLNVISEANVVLTDKLSLVEKKLEVFKCIDILDRVTKLEEQLKPTVLEEVKELEVKPSVLDDILDKISHLEEKVINTQLMMHSIDLKLNALDKIVKDKVCTIKPCENMEDPTPIYYDNELKYFAMPGSAKSEIHDSVNHPLHYTDGKYETIDFIEEYGMVTHIGNAIKYISRSGKKDTSKYAEDLNKAFWYLHRYNLPGDKAHIDVIDYCHEKKLPMELTAVIIAISREDYKEAEQILSDYITKITGKTPKALEDEQSK